MPRSKVCGGCLARGGQDSLHRLGLERVLQDAVALHTMRICAAGHNIGIALKPMLGIDRARLDAGLTRLAAEAGADVLDGTSARATPEGRVTLRRGDGSARLHAGAVIVADGLSGSALSDEPDFTWRVGRWSKVGVGGVVARIEGVAENTITMCVGREGYVGVAPIEAGRMAVAAALNVEALGAEGGMRRILTRIVQASGASIELPPDLPLKGVAQLTRRRACVEAGRVLVAGDATGYVEPFTGEGMSWAIRAGELSAAFAARLARSALRRGEWSRVLDDEFGLARRRCTAVAALLERPILLRLSMTLADAAPAAATMLSGLFGRVAQRSMA
ncbi:MAG: hypothetical protein Kow0022_05990 [Phycisphaerales bacterium]